MKKIVKDLIKYGKRAGKKNFTPGMSGNISARFGNNIIITTSGSANGYLKEDDFVVIDFDGNVVQGNKKPSSEKMLHVEFYKMLFFVYKFYTTFQFLFLHIQDFFYHFHYKIHYLV